MWDPKKDDKLQHALQNYLSQRGLVMSDKAKYDVIIDGVDITIDGFVVLEIGLPPVSDYSINETEFTNKFLKPANTLVA